MLLSASFPSSIAFIFLTGIDLWKRKYVMVMFPVSLRRLETVILKSRTDALAAYFPFWSLLLQKINLLGMKTHAQNSAAVTW